MNIAPVIRKCRTCGADFEQRDKPVLNCGDCRRAWRENGRKPDSATSKLRRALERIKAVSSEASVREIAIIALREAEPQ